MELFDEVAAIIIRNKGEAMNIKPRDRLREDLHIDSLDTMLIGCELEDHFHITIDPEEIRSLNLVQDIIERLKVKIGAHHQAAA